MRIDHRRTIASVKIGFVTMALAFGAGAATAQTGAAAPSAGQWVFQTADGKRKCTLALRDAPALGGAMALGAPATCRKSMRALTGAVGWTALGPDRIDFIDKAGAPTLSFAKRDNVLSATGADSETYYLLRPGETVTPSGAPGFQSLSIPGAINSAKPDAPAPGFSQTAAAATQPGPTTRAADIPGRYAVLRDTTRDTGCMLTLDATPRGAGARALLAPACRDNGISIFEPTAWSFAGGKLTLTARKGHRAHFIMTQDGSWQKDPKEGGKPLGFRKM